MDDDFDLEGLSPAQARSYVAQFITSQRETREQLGQAESELATWKKRVQLATERGETDLARDALARAEESHKRVVELRRETRGLDFKVMELKRRLTELERAPQTTVDANALLEQLESVVGSDHATDEALADAEAEVALEALKRKMREQEPPGTDG